MEIIQGFMQIMFTPTPPPGEIKVLNISQFKKNY